MVLHSVAALKSILDVNDHCRQINFFSCSIVWIFFLSLQTSSRETWLPTLVTVRRHNNKFVRGDKAKSPIFSWSCRHDKNQLVIHLPLSAATRLYWKMGGSDDPRPKLTSSTTFAIKFVPLEPRRLDAWVIYRTILPSSSLWLKCDTTLFLNFDFIQPAALQVKNHVLAFSP